MREREKEKRKGEKEGWTCGEKNYHFYDVYRRGWETIFYSEKANKRGNPQV